MDVEQITLDTTLIRGTGVVEAEINSEVVAMNIETGNCYGLNSVGSRVWQLLASPISVRNLCEQLRAEFDVAPDICEREVLNLLRELRAEDLVSAV